MRWIMEEWWQVAEVARFAPQALNVWQIPQQKRSLVIFVRLVDLVQTILHASPYTQRRI
jgi:hypothetical protein